MEPNSSGPLNSRLANQRIPPVRQTNHSVSPPLHLASPPPLVAAAHARLPCASRAIDVPLPSAAAQFFASPCPHRRGCRRRPSLLVVAARLPSSSPPPRRTSGRFRPPRGAPSPTQPPPPFPFASRRRRSCGGASSCRRRLLQVARRACSSKIHRSLSPTSLLCCRSRSAA